MQIACPSCGATYEVPAARLKPGRSARCAACGAEWKPAAETEPAPPEAEPPPAIPAASPVAEAAAVPAPFLSAMERLAAEPSPSPRSPALLAAWLLTALLLAAGGISAVVWRAEIMRVLAAE